MYILSNCGAFCQSYWSLSMNIFVTTIYKKFCNLAIEQLHTVLTWTRLQHIKKKQLKKQGKGFQRTDVKHYNDTSTHICFHFSLEFFQDFLSIDTHSSFNHLHFNSVQLQYFHSNFFQVHLTHQILSALLLELTLLPLLSAYTNCHFIFLQRYTWTSFPFNCVQHFNEVKWLFKSLQHFHLN